MASDKAQAAGKPLTIENLQLADVRHEPASRGVPPLSSPVEQIAPCFQATMTVAVLRECLRYSE